MKRNRNSFFAESSAQGGLIPNANGMPNGMPNANAMGYMPYQAANSYFYQGPNLPNNYNTPESDIESRLAKIERQLNRLDKRIASLENNANIYTTEDIESTTTNMYMV